MGKDYIVGEVYVEYNDPIYDITFVRMGDTANFQVFDDLGAVRSSGEPEVRFHRLPNGMYLWKGDIDERFWKYVYLTLRVDTLFPIARYMPAGPKRDALEKEIRRRGGAVRVREGTSTDGLYFHDTMLKDLGAMIVKAIADPDRKASERRSKRAAKSRRNAGELTLDTTLPGFKYQWGELSRYGHTWPETGFRGAENGGVYTIRIHDRLTGEIVERRATYHSAGYQSWFEISWEGKRIDLSGLMEENLPESPSQRRFPRCVCTPPAKRRTPAKRRA